MNGHAKGVTSPEKIKGTRRRSKVALAAGDGSIADDAKATVSSHSLDNALDEALEETFPASDPVSSLRDS